jgi:hypothetical protein
MREGAKALVCIRWEQQLGSSHCQLTSMVGCVSCTKRRISPTSSAHVSGRATPPFGERSGNTKASDWKRSRG